METVGFKKMTECV